jgi:hypothetical protein
LREAAKSGEEDFLKGTTECMMMGKESRVGTGITCMKSLPIGEVKNYELPLTPTVAWNRVQLIAYTLCRA